MTPSSLIGLLEQRREHSAARPFLHADGRSLTVAELGARSDACAAALAATGVRSGDHVALMLENSADFVAAFFAVARLGAVAVTLNTALKGDTLSYILGHCDAKALLVESELEAVAAEAAASCGELRTTFIRGEPASRDAFELETAIAAHLGDPIRSVRPAPGDVAAILYTSGTTGRPKGVMVTGHGYPRAATWFVESLRLGSEDVLHTCLPLFHINAQQLSLCGALVCGGELVLEHRFSASRFWDSISTHGVTSFNLVGAMLGILHLQPPSPEERRHRVRVACVAPVPAQIHRECEERFGIMLLDGYGLTETTPGMTFNPYGAARVGSCGKPAPYVQLRIVDEQGDELAPGEPGEILIRHLEPNILMAGYYKDREATDAVVRDGWFRTGDRGYIDEDGFLYFVDRIKEVIRRRGENISPIEIERAALRHPAIAEAAAVGVPSDLIGGEDDVALYVIPHGGWVVRPEEVITTCEERLAAFMVPRYVGVLREFPRTETHRVRRFALRERGVSGCYDRLAHTPSRR